jgi:HAE1 family hydrophobic/amphiphilic exporter-1
VFISQPLALVVIGGLISSTVLTLLLVPVLYTALESRREKRAARRAQPRVGTVDTPAEERPVQAGAQA